MLPYKPTLYQPAYQACLQAIQKEGYLAGTGVLLAYSGETRTIIRFVPTPNMEQHEEGEIRKNLHLQDLLEQKTRYQYTSWCVEHAIQIEKMLCGGVTFLGFWVYCDKEELKETRCLNLLAGMLVKAKKFIKTSDPLILMPIFSNNKGGLPEVWVRGEGTSLVKAKDQIKQWNNIERLAEFEAKLPISIVYPLPKSVNNIIQFKEMLKKMTEDFKSHIEPLKYTVNGKIVGEEVGIENKQHCVVQFYGSSTGPLVIEENRDSERYLHLSGVLQGKAYGTAKITPTSLAVNSLKEDLVRTLRVGIELTLQDLESSGTAIENNIVGEEWTPKALSSDKLKKKSEFRIRLPHRVFYTFPPDEAFNYCEYQMPHEEHAEVYQRIQEMFLVDPVFPGKTKGEGVLKRKTEKTVADIKKAMIEEKKEKVNDKGMKGVIIVGIAMIFLAIYVYLYLKH